MKTRAYARYSMDNQTEASIADQLRVIRDFAAARNWTVDLEHSDYAISGAAFGNRPAFLEMRDAALAGKFDVLLVMDTTRLCRSQDLAPLIARLKHRGVRVLGVQDGFDSDSRTARMQAGLSGIMSEEFRTQVADRTRSALEMRARNNQSAGGKHYENEEIVREIFRRFASGETMKRIVSDLNKRDVPSPGAKWKLRTDGNPRGRWQVSTVHALLRNEKYIGRVIWNRSQWIKDPDSGKRIRRERPEGEWIVGECAPMVDRETWDRAHARFSVGKMHVKKGGVSTYLLSGLLECGLCGSKMIIMGGGQRRYVCGSFHSGGVHACANDVTFPRAIAEERILAPIMADLLSPEAVAEGIKYMREERAKLEAAPKVADKEIAELERLVREGLLSAATAAPALATARRRVRMDGAERALPWPSESLWRDGVDRMRELLTGSNVPAAREALRELIGPTRIQPRGDHVIAELTGRSSVLGIRVRCGGRICIHIPTSTVTTGRIIFQAPNPLPAPLSTAA